LKSFWLLLVPLAIGCASRKDIRGFKEDTMLLHIQVKALRQENEQILKKLEEMNKSIDEVKSETRRSRADLATEMQGLEEHIQFLNNRFDEAGSPSTRSMSRLALDSTSLIAAGVRDHFTELNSRANELYNTANLDLAAGRHELALKGFQEILNSYPGEEVAPLAQYGIGEIYYAKGEYKRAENEFKKVILHYPAHDRVLPALLKLSRCEMELGDKRTAMTNLQAIIQWFPQTEEAMLAKNLLEQLR